MNPADSGEIQKDGIAQAAGLPPPVPPLFRRMGPVTFALLSLCIVFFLYQFVAGGITLVLFGTQVTTENVALVRWSTMLGQLLFILVPTVVLVRLRGRRPGPFFRFHVPDVRQLVLVILATFALQQMLQGYMAVQDLIPLPTELQKILDTIRKMYEETYKLLLVTQSPVELLWVILIAALIPALSEELLFRGLVQRSLEEATGGLAGAVITGIIFGLYHLIPTNVVPLAIFGVFLGFVVYRTQNIVISMSAHFFNNLVACVAVYLDLKDDFVMVAPAGNGPALLLVLNFILCTLVFVAATAYFMRLTRRTEGASGISTEA